MHSIPYDQILQCAKDILKTDRVKSELKQITLWNGIYNYDLLFLLSLNGHTMVEDGLCRLSLYFKSTKLYILDNSLSGITGDYTPFSSHPNLFVDQVEIIDHPYHYTLLAYVFQKY